MWDETKTTGTDSPDGGDASEDTSTTGTQEDQDRNAESEEGDYVKVPKGELDSWKSKAERTNELERENAELKARTDQSPADPSDKPAKGDGHWDEVRGFAEKGDPVAKAVLAQRKREQKLVGAVSAALELADIDDKTERADVKKLVLQGHDVRSAKNEIRLRNVEKENERLRAENLKHQQRKDNPDVVRTHDREVFASELKTKTKLPESQWDARQKYLKDQGPAGARQAMNEQQAYARGELDIEMGR